MQGVPDVDPLQQLKPGASLDDILAAVNASAAKTDSLELVLKLVGTDVTGLSFSCAKTAERCSALEKQFAALNEKSAPVLSQAGTLTPPQQPALLPPPPPPPVHSPQAPNLPAIGEGCQVKLECNPDANFHGPSTYYIFSELRRAKVPLPDNTPLSWPQAKWGKFTMAVATLPSPGSALGYITAVERFLKNVPAAQLAGSRHPCGSPARRARSRCRATTPSRCGPVVPSKRGARWKLQRT